MDFALARRVEVLPPYPFAKLRAAIAAKKARGINVISLGIGDPDRHAPDVVVEELCRAARDRADPNKDRYGCDAPVAALPEAIKNFYHRRYGVDLQPEQIQPTMGSKDAIVKLCMGLINPGDIGIAPCPGYPTYNIGHTFASGVTYRVRLRAEDGFLMDFDGIPQEVRRLAKILWLNYPNNPTSAVADLDFFRRAVEFGRQNNILIAHDSAYSENTFDGYQAPSILQVPGADEVAVEFFSLSKAFNMTGWRLGCLVGNASAVQALHLVKDNVDNGTFRAVQFAGAKALDHAEKIFTEVNAVYKERRDLVVNALRAQGWTVNSPQATVYVWAPVPEKYHGSSEAFATDLLEKTNVAITPGRAFGEGGEGFYRISLTYPIEALKEALDRIAKL
ncbi:LL-diaminopimelate aminotransferase [Planctomycetales bacterium]|nr:LL-diaminopimelate aminotransferase [Planctomycetales bacterium]GHS98791.1 LL-diaminopimelate aminotransferase [Planctomycetales bacterium]GHT06553.1 LL-diaminopimelate aminotransferase [Planctomycetales bacterium]